MAEFCGKCGSRLITTNGLCPKCDEREIVREKWRFIVAGVLLFVAILILMFAFS